MTYKGHFSDKSPFFQLWLLLGLIVASTFFVLLLGSLLTYILKPGYNITEHVDMLRFVQLVSSITTFLLPSILIGYTCSEYPRKYLFIENFPQWGVILMVFFCITLITPFITLTGYFNSKLMLPDFLAPIQQWIEETERNAEIMTSKLLENSNFLSIISNLIVIALGAALCEEFLFRGAIFRIVERIFKRKDAVIWSCAFIFSAVHMQFFGFIPRLLLGAYFGYLLVWSGNIWIPVAAHFFNNATAVLLLSYESSRNSEYVTGKLADNSVLSLTIISVVCLALFYFCNIQLKRRLQKIH